MLIIMYVVHSKYQAAHQQGVVLQVDGTLDVGNSDILLQLVRSSRLFGSAHDSLPRDLILPNNERLRLPVGLQVIWELESLADLAPNVVSELGLLVLGSKGEWFAMVLLMSLK